MAFNTKQSVFSLFPVLPYTPLEIRAIRVYP